MDSQVQKLTAKGRATRQRIIDGAAAEIREQGVDGGDPRRHHGANRDLEKPAVPLLPGGKEQLLLAVAEHEAQQVLDDQQPYLGELTSWAAWQRWRDAVVDRYRRQGQNCPLSVLMSEIGRTTPGAQAVTSALMRQWHDEVAAGVRHMHPTTRCRTNSTPTGSPLLCSQGFRVASASCWPPATSVTSRPPSISGSLRCGRDRRRCSYPQSEFHPQVGFELRFRVGIMSSVEGMFDHLVDAALGSRASAAVGAWARVENAACARRLFAMADELDAMLAADGSLEREQWCLDNWDAVAASVAAAQNVSLGVASHQLLIADALRQRLPRVAEVFAAGAISYRMVAAVVSRTRLIQRPGRAGQSRHRDRRPHRCGGDRCRWIKPRLRSTTGSTAMTPRRCGAPKTRARTLCRCRANPRTGRGPPTSKPGCWPPTPTPWTNAWMRWRARCATAIPAPWISVAAMRWAPLGHGAERLACQCGRPDCDAAGAQPSAVVVHVIAHEDSLSDDTPVQLDGKEPAPTASRCAEMTLHEALTDPRPPPTGPADTPPAALMGGGMLPAPLLAAKIAGTAKIVPIVHPGDTAPQPRYIPTAVLATFIRCRDMTCRFPGCDEPAHHCDIDHTIAYPAGPTQASNLKCLCRKHHLLKTFGGWHDQQSPDGTVVWTSPHGQTLHHPPRQPNPVPHPVQTHRTRHPCRRADAPANRALAMPRRKQPEPRTAPKPSTTNANTTKSSSEPRSTRPRTGKNPATKT